MDLDLLLSRDLSASQTRTEPSTFQCRDEGWDRTEVPVLSQKDYGGGGGGEIGTDVCTPPFRPFRPNPIQLQPLISLRGLRDRGNMIKCIIRNIWFKIKLSHTTICTSLCRRHVPVRAYPSHPCNVVMPKPGNSPLFARRTVASSYSIYLAGSLCAGFSHQVLITRDIGYRRGISSRSERILDYTWLRSLTRTQPNPIPVPRSRRSTVPPAPSARARPVLHLHGHGNDTGPRPV